MVAKSKIKYVCSECGSVEPKWQGKCPACNSWNTLEEQVVPESPKSSNRLSSWTGASSGVIDFTKVKASKSVIKSSSGIGEFDRVLGGGLVEGSIILLGGDPGIGKSTLILQTVANIASTSQKVMYVTGEESDSQIVLRAERLGLSISEETLKLCPQIDMLEILRSVEEEQPKFLIVDSIQTVYSPELQSSPGTVSQVRECASQLTRLAKSKGVTVILIGHVTKEGDLAGPRVLEHMVDTLLYFEGDSDSNFRMLRALKNRFGSVNELGVFNMTEGGLEEVSNPSGLFLTPHDTPVSGSVIFCAMEGNRPFLVEVQALVEDSVSPNPRRYASGIDLNRIQMVVAVLNKHSSISAADQNIYVKVVGGVRLTEPAADLAAFLAIASSLKNKSVPNDTVVIGEVGLAGEIRAVSNIDARIKECISMGFKTIIVPKSAKVKDEFKDVTIHRFGAVSEIANFLRNC